MITVGVGRFCRRAEVASMLDASSLPLFYQIAALLVLAATVGLIGLALQQPLIVSYIVVGLISGPSALVIAEASEHIDLLAEPGVAPLLFLLALTWDPGLIRSVGLVAAATGTGKVLVQALVGFFL